VGGINQLHFSAIKVGLGNGPAEAITGRSVQRFLMYFGRAAGLECPTTQDYCYSLAKNLIDADIGLEREAVLPG